MRSLYIAALASLCAATPAIIQAAETASPAELIKKVADEVLDEIKRDASLQNDSAKLQAMVNTRIAPHFDFTRLTQLAMGRHWRAASPDQKTQLTEQFSKLLVRTYSNALVNYRNQEIEYLPIKGSTSDKDVVVRTRVHGGGKAPVAVDYTLASTSNGWKTYDVTVAGVSLVTNYRDEFNAAIHDKGIDGLISLLKDKNSKPVVPKNPS